MINNYEKILERISRVSGISLNDLDRMIEAKRAKFSGLISKEGAAQIISSELGINFDSERIKIGELFSGMKKVNVVGKIIKLFPVRSYEKKGKSGKIGSFIIADESGNVRSVLWDTNHISLLERGEIKEGDIVEVNSASIRNGELHLTGFSNIKKSNEIISNVNASLSYAEKSIAELKPGENVRFRGIIVQVYPLKSFNVCPECGKRVDSECTIHGKVVPLKKNLLSVVFDDGTETIRGVLFQEGIDKIDINEMNFERKLDEILGKEAYFSGNVRINKLFNTQEIVINDIEEVDIGKLIEKLEKR
ncbi:hypothetical protein HYV49_02425 [Candidatus Pacearchaeota archaeon]|nr:hypothetical protein [Candidatus Pacearchaeota archaeon]